MAIITESHFASEEAMNHYTRKELSEFADQMIKAEKATKFILTLQAKDHYLDQQGKTHSEKAKIQFQYRVMLGAPMPGVLISHEGDLIGFQKRRAGGSDSEQVILGKNNITYSAYNKEGVHLGDKVLRCYFHNLNYLNQQEQLNPKASFIREPHVCEGCRGH